MHSPLKAPSPADAVARPDVSTALPPSLLADEVTRVAVRAALPPKRRRRRRIIGLSVFALGLAGVAALIWNWSESAPNMQAITAPLGRGDVVSTIAASGNVRPVSIVRVSTLQGGTLTQIPVDFNSDVHKGDLLARIDDASQRNELSRARAEVAAATAQVRVQDAAVAEREAELKAAEARHDQTVAAVALSRVDLGLAENALDRNMALQKNGWSTVVSALNARGSRDSMRAKLQQAESEVAHAQAMRAAAAATLLSARAQRESANSTFEQAVAHEQKARIDLERTEIRSPVDGTVVWKSVDVGQTVSTNVEPPVLFFIAQDLTEVQIETTIDENDVSQLRVGQPVTFTVAAYPAEQFTGSVKQVRTGSEALFGSRAGSASAVTYIIEIATANTDRRLLPGMTASVRIITAAAKDALTVPTAALRYGDTFIAKNDVRMPNIVGARPLVLAAADNSLRVIAVKTLASDGVTTAIYTGAPLSEGDRAIIAERRGRDE